MALLGGIQICADVGSAGTKPSWLTVILVMRVYRTLITSITENPKKRKALMKYQNSAIVVCFCSSWTVEKSAP